MTHCRLIRKYTIVGEHNVELIAFIKYRRRMSFPNRQARQTCWDYRDEYWKCLDEGKTEDQCKQFREQYEKFCPTTWVKHFDRKREYMKFKEQIEQGGYVGEETEGNMN